MKKKLKNQYIDIIESMTQGIHETSRLIYNHKENEAQELLIQLQETAISVGEGIESLAGECGEAITMLEEFCEELWDCNQHLKSVTMCKKSISRMSSLLISIKNIIQEAVEQFDIVFMPYKASMWDSMESVWLAACKDSRMKCYVVPIPYYDKDKSGNLGQFHYEGRMFPSDVEVLNYRDFDLNRVQPEVIYIHNPFDQFNYVTSIHPNYYSVELKKYTQKLVYIPYYCTNGNLPKGHENFIAYYTADYTIVQNEDVRKALLDNNDIDKSKVIALGSPKIDKMVYAKKDGNLIPKEWEEQLQGKVSFLYNVSISKLLKNGEKTLGKMEGVFDYFSKRDDVVLIWRPHPLLRATLLSMRSELADQYDKLVKKFFDCNIGIFDESGDVNRTVAIADAYIGDSGSSVVCLAGVLGKPLMGLSDQLFTQKSIADRNDFVFLDCYIEGEMGWFIDSYHHYLCQISFATSQIEVLDTVPETLDSIANAYINIVKHNNKLYLMPYHAQGICEYDLVNGNFTKYYFKQENVTSNFVRMEISGDEIFLIPSQYSSIVCFNTISKHISYYRDCIDELKLNPLYVRGSDMFLLATCVYKNTLYMGTIWANYIVEFQLDSKEYSIHEIGDKNFQCRGLVADDKYCWIIQQNNPTIICWDKGLKTVTEFSVFPKGFRSGNIPFKSIVDNDDFLYLIPCNANMALKLDKRTTKISMASWSNQLMSPVKNADINVDIQFHFGKRTQSDEVVLYKKNTNKLYKISASDEISKECLCKISNQKMIEEIVKNCKSRVLEHSVIPFLIEETQDNMLDDFVEYVISKSHSVQEQKKFYSKMAVNSDGTCGEKIHQFVMDSMSD